MSREQLENIKREDKKQGKKYITLLIVCFVAGGIGGVLTAFLADRGILYGLADMISTAIRKISIYYNLVATVILCVVVSLIYKKSKSVYTAWNGEDEAVIEKVEKLVSINLIIIGIHSIFYLIFMTIGCVEVTYEIEADRWPATEIIIMAIGFVVSSVFTVKGQQKLVNFTKEINPEKKGSVYDAKFQEKWLDSCDEMEKMRIYESGYAAFKTVNTACIVLDILCFLGMFVWNVGILPVCMVGIIWIINALAYYIKAMQLETKKYK